jgi:glycosyltransferase involved in cell wall biosynthesis
MRVLYCTDTYPPQVNGVSVVTALSAAGLTARGWECAVVAPRYPSQATSSAFGDPPANLFEKELTSLPSVPMPTYPETRLCAPDYFAVLSAVRRFAPDLVHCQTEFIIGRLGQLAAASRGVRLVSSYHTDFAKYTAAYGVPALTGAVSKYIARFHGRSGRTYTPSKAARAYLLSFGVRNVEVWGRGVDIQTFHPRAGAPHCGRSSAWRESSSSCMRGGSPRRKGWGAFSTLTAPRGRRSPRGRCTS